VTHHTASRFWVHCETLPAAVRTQADKQFALLKANPSHPSLRRKKVGRFWPARVNAEIRALAVQIEDTFVWFWIGDHREYDRLIKKG
jgi:hypothetical protein